MAPGIKWCLMSARLSPGMWVRGNNPPAHTACAPVSLQDDGDGEDKHSYLELLKRNKTFFRGIHCFYSSALILTSLINAAILVLSLFLALYDMHYFVYSNGFQLSFSEVLQQGTWDFVKPLLLEGVLLVTPLDTQGVTKILLFDRAAFL